MLNFALEYAAKGMMVFPCNKHKHPITENGFHDATTDPDQIRRWWTKNPNASIGYALPDDTAVVDIDIKPYEGKFGNESLEEYEREHGKLPDTVMQITGGGGLQYFFSTDRKLWCRNGLLPSIDIKTHGGYVILPPSNHESGNCYQWDAAFDINDIPLAPLPEGIYKLMEQSRQGQNKRLEIPEVIGKGVRNDIIFKLCCSFRQRGLTDIEILAAVSCMNQERCNPPLSDKELTAIIQSSIKYERGQLPQVQAWETPIPLNNITLPEFPIDTLTAWIREYCQAVSENCQIGIDIPIVSALGILSTCLQKKFIVVNHAGWKIPINIYMIFIAESADGKSPALSCFTFPIFEHEREFNKQNKDAIDESKARIKFATSKLAKVTRAKNPQFHEIKECEKLLREAEEAAIYPMQSIAQDFSIEALGELLRKQGGKISVISSEGGFFSNIGGRYSDKDIKQIDIILQAYNGISDPVLRFNRIGRGDFEIIEPATTITLGAQDVVLRELMADETLKRKGLHARFFYSKPVSKVGNRRFRDIPLIPEELKLEYSTRIKSLLDIHGKQTELTLSDEAQELLTQYCEWREPLLGEGEELFGIQSWAGKSDIACMRLAGLLHVAENIVYTTPYKNDNPIITATTMEKAIRLVRDYFLPHAQHCFLEAGADPNISEAKYILGKIKEHNLKQFNKTELVRKCRKYTSTEELVEPLQYLVQLHYLREESQQFVVNPLWRDLRD